MNTHFRYLLYKTHCILFIGYLIYLFIKDTICLLLTGHLKPEARVRSPHIPTVPAPVGSFTSLLSATLTYLSFQLSQKLNNLFLKDECLEKGPCQPLRNHTYAFEKTAFPQ